MPYSKLANVNADDIRALAITGMNGIQISEHFQVTPVALYQHLRTRGINTPKQMFYDYMMGRAEELRNDYCSGITFRELASKYNIPMLMARNIVRGAERPNEDRTIRLHDKRDKKIWSLHKIGVSHAMIGRKLGITRERVRQIVHALTTDKNKVTPKKRTKNGSASVVISQ